MEFWSQLQAPMVNTGAEEPAQIVTKLRQALDAIGRLSSERAALEEALKVGSFIHKLKGLQKPYDRRAYPQRVCTHTIGA